MPALELFDTVVLKTNRQFVGILERTHYEGTEQPLDDCLIIAHTFVEENVLAQFVQSGVPPRHHIFVRFAELAQGYSLLHEDDVELLDRSFTLGDVVKQEGSQMLGTVVDLTESFVLQPVWRSCPSTSHEGFTIIPADDPAGRSAHVCTQACPLDPLDAVSHPFPSDLIFNVPGRELKKAADVLEGDYLIQGDWFGVVEEMDLSITIMLGDGSIVVAHNAEELYIPVPDHGKRIISLPEYDSYLRRPDILVAQQGWSATMPLPPDDFQSGQMAITNHRNLQHGRWLRGTFSRDIPPQGRVLDVRTKNIVVRWLTCNAFISSEVGQASPPSTEVSMYENLSTFTGGSEIRRNKKITIVDSTKMPRGFEDRRRFVSELGELSHSTLATGIRVGDHVRFRDQAGAAVKYQGVVYDNLPHGRFTRLVSSAMFKFNLSELKVIQSRQEVTVRWQDGITAKHSSLRLMRFPLFESDMSPSDIVVARDGLQQRPAATPKSSWTGFNEMTFFEQSHNIMASKVGIVQTVDSVGRVARVRWFSNPYICLLNFGHILSGESRFGKMSGLIEDVSLFEIMSFPALVRKLKDTVIIVPATPSNKGAAEVTSIPLQDTLETGTAVLSALNPYDRLTWLRNVARAQTVDTSFRTISTGSTQRQSGRDWVGDLVCLGTDGTVTVRVDQGDFHQDILLAHDQILCFVDESAINGDNSFEDGSDLMDIDTGYSDDVGSDGSGEVSAISEIVEYEGGKRLDEDSGDDNWEDADEPALENLSELENTQPCDIKADQSTLVGEEGSQIDSQAKPESKATTTYARKHLGSGSGILTQLQSARPTSPPPAFAVLDSDPPADQFGLSKSQSTSATKFLKRIAGEHRILMSALPVSEIYVRTYENRLDLLRCLIIGPADTAYEFAPFLIDLQLGPRFPKEPPTAYFHSWTSGLGRINPNLYEEGKICLSLLGTWQGKSETESWNEHSTILQLLVSLQGLVFVKQPFYNEAGFEGYAEDGAYKTESERYTEKAFVMARAFIKHALQSPVVGLEDVLAWLYLPHDDRQGLLEIVIQRSRDVIRASQGTIPSKNDDLMDGTGTVGNPTKVFLKPLSRGAIVTLEKTITILEHMLHSRSIDQVDTDRLA